MLGLLLGLWLAACGESLDTVPSSSLRFEIDRHPPDAALQVKILDPEDCDMERYTAETCYPRVLRAVGKDLGENMGEVRVAFRILADGEPFAIPLSHDQISVTHRKTRVTRKDGFEFELKGHAETQQNQLFIVVIDGSGSMNEKVGEGAKATRMNRVRRALLRPDVVGRFFPEGNTWTGVLLMNFTSGEPIPVGGEVEIIISEARYKQKILEELGVRGGYTHLYRAVRYATGNLLKTDAVKAVISGQGALPTVVVLTDGFNNEAAADLCRDNAPRLNKLLNHLHRVRSGRGMSVRARPTVYTVGLGRPIWPRYKLPDSPGYEVSVGELCSKQADRRIDGDLERYGIDNVSLKWIAHVGGGQSNVRTDIKGLGEAFVGASPQRYDWFEVRYRMDSLHMRRSFETMVELTRYPGAQGRITFYPSAWFDPPTATSGADGWAQLTPIWASLVLVLPILGGLLGITFFGAASYNVRRAIFRGRPRKPKKA